MVPIDYSTCIVIFRPYSCSYNKAITFQNIFIMIMVEDIYKFSFVLFDLNYKRKYHKEKLKTKTKTIC